MEQSKVTLGAADLSVRRGGSGDPLLVLHGEDGHLFSGRLLERLEDHFEVIAPDHPGWGMSTRPPHVDRVRDLAELYVELLETLDGPVPVLGWSLGAWIASEMAVQCSHDISGLVLVSPIGAKFGGREDRDYVDIYVMPDGERTDVMYGDPANAPDYSAFSEDDFITLAQAEEATVRYTWRPYMHDPKLRHRLRRISVPTLVLYGSANRFVLRHGYFENFADSFEPPAQRTVIAGGHRLEEEDPDAVARLASEFLAGSAHPNEIPVLTDTERR